MAFMMPVMKKNYALYGKQQRKNASETDSGGGGGGDGRRKISTVSSSAHPAHRRRVKSEGPSLSTSPATAMTGAEAMAQRTKPIGMRRGRGSAPALAALAPSVTSHLHHSCGPSTAPGSSPAPISVVSSPSRSSSSSSSSGSGAALGRFHTKLVARLRRSLRLKDPEPTPT